MNILAYGLIVLAILGGIWWFSGERVRALESEMKAIKLVHAAKQSKQAIEIEALRKQKREVIYAPRQKIINAAPPDCIPLDGPVPEWLHRMLDDAGYLEK